MLIASKFRVHWFLISFYIFCFSLGKGCVGVNEGIKWRSPAFVGDGGSFNWEGKVLYLRILGEALNCRTPFLCSMAMSSTASPSIQLPFPYYSSQYGMPTGLTSFLWQVQHKFLTWYCNFMNRGASCFVHICKLWSRAVPLDSGEATFLGSPYMLVHGSGKSISTLISSMKKLHIRVRLMQRWCLTKLVIFWQTCNGKTDEKYWDCYAQNKPYWSEFLYMALNCFSLSNTSLCFRREYICTLLNKKNHEFPIN